MGQTFQADTPGNRYLMTLGNASVASNGAAALVGYMFRAPSNITLLGAYWTPTGADQTGHATSYRRLSIINASTDGSGTVVLASLNITASKASNTPVALTGSATVGSTNIIGFSQTTVGGAKDTETILQAGLAQIEYRLI